MFRAPYLISIWALYESGVIDLTNYIQEKERALIALSDIRGRSLQDQLEKYYTGVLKVAMPIPPQTFSALNDIQLLRNAIAHRNGLIDNLDESRKARINRIVESRADIEIVDSILSFSNAFLSYALDVATTALAAIDALCAERYNTINLIEMPNGRDT